MGWSKQLDNKNGSQPRCVLLVGDEKEEVANRLTTLVSLDDVTIASSDTWKPWGKPVKKEDGLWDNAPSQEASLNGLKELLSCDYGKKRSKRIKQHLGAWWNPKGGKTPTWDIASTCRISGISGLLLVEAKAHGNEKLSGSDKSGSRNPENREHIGSAIAQAASGLESVTGNPWRISPDHHYQLSNRFAWSWKLASLGIPVVLLYLGFLRAEDMAKKGKPVFHSGADWGNTLKRHCEGVIDNACWDRRWCVNGIPLLPIIRAFEQPFKPCQD